jgi:dienelactone hydrolase
MTDPAPILSLEGRLLCAAQQAYEIQVSGAVPASPSQPSPPPSTLIGWTGAPQCKVSGDDGISAVLVGETDYAIVVAYRGTEPFDSPDRERMVLDWIHDAIDFLVTAPNIPGSVHRSFSHQTNELWSWTLAAVQALPKTKPVYVTGHSKGGAMANIAACKFVAAGFAPYVCTFEGARAGDQAFADGYATRVPHSVRWEYQDDIVPHLPPDLAFAPLLEKAGLLPAGSLLGGIAAGFLPSYVSVGKLKFIDWLDAVISGDSASLEAERYSHLLALIEAFDFDTIIDDHSIAPGSGAASVICGPVWPLLLHPPASTPRPRAA